ncbi:TPA: hypothetical protein JH903_003111 [Acinetobacter baumannii]|nr:hypothetical protein [Acinetobacter baumannii]
MCILCILRAEAEQNQAQSQRLEQAAQEAAASIATKLFGEDVVKAAIAERRAADKAEQDNVIKFPRAGSTMPTTAQDFLKRAQNHMEDRAVTYDSPEGERSMEKTVQIFNALRERDLTETEGWLFMSILKMVRANQGEFKSDNYEDLVAYAALMGESEVKAQA